MRNPRWAGIACFLAGCVASPAESPEPRVALGGDSPLVAAFERAEYDTGVPAELLASLAYVETRLQNVTAMHAHDAPAYGVFGLSPTDLETGARLAGVTDEAARTDTMASIHAGAALLRANAPDAITLDDFLNTLAPTLRSEVTAALARGIDGRDDAGRSVIVAARGGRAKVGVGVATQALGYTGAEWVPASPQNYQAAGRTTADHVVIHTTQGSYAGTLSWFKNPDAQVSAHYVLRSSDGHVAQMVDEKNVAWHDKCFNETTVGIEHEGYIEKPALWYTEVMYTESAKLTSYLCDKYRIPKELGPIVGHGEAPDCSDHTDPGPGWDWAHYIDLVKTGGGQFAASDVVVDAPATLTSGDRATVTVTITNQGSATWDLDITRLGTTQPRDRESALFVDGDWISPRRATAVDATTKTGETATFTFEIVAPTVREPTVYDEAFQLVENEETWFGPDVHVAIQVMPDGSSGGCSTTNPGSGALGCGMVALGVALARRRRSGR